MKTADFKHNYDWPYASAWIRIFRWAKLKLSNARPGDMPVISYDRLMNTGPGVKQIVLAYLFPACLAEWSLSDAHHQCVRSVCRHVDRVDEELRVKPKLGSLIGEAKDVARRTQLANVAFRKLSTVWFRRSRISLPLRLRLYESFVVPVLISWVRGVEWHNRSWLE